MKYKFIKWDITNYNQKKTQKDKTTKFKAKI